jgi:hypothetical protein
MTQRISESFMHDQLTNWYNEKAKTVRDIVVVTISIMFFSCTLYYAIFSSKNISARGIDYKPQLEQEQNQNI